MQGPGAGCLLGHGAQMHYVALQYVCSADGHREKKVYDLTRDSELDAYWDTLQQLGCASSCDTRMWPFCSIPKVGSTIGLHLTNKALGKPVCCIHEAGAVVCQHAKAVKFVTYSGHSCQTRQCT